jgi:hypothetical protein
MRPALLPALAVAIAAGDARAGSWQVGFEDAPVRQGPDAGAPMLGTLAAYVRLPRLSQHTGRGCDGPWIAVQPEGFVCSEMLRASPREPHQPDLLAVPTGKVLPYRYGFARRGGARLFVRPGDPDSVDPVRRLEPGFGLGLRHLVRVHGRFVWRTVSGRYVLDDELRHARPIEFEGLRIPKGERPDVGWTFAATTAVVPEAGVARWNAIAALETRTRVRVVSETTVDDVAWLRVRFAPVRRFPRDPEVSEGWVKAAAVRRASYAPRPEEAGDKDRWIDVDLGNQTLVAWDGDTPAFATIVSTGRWSRTTPRGVHRIHSKYARATMDDEDPRGDDSPYALEDVPWVQYFAGGVGFHAAFWHAAFGYRVSHGCVNLAPNDARFLYDWTAVPVPPGWTARFATGREPGTVVRVR